MSSSIRIVPGNAQLTFLKPRFMRALKKDDIQQVEQLLTARVDVDTTFNAGYSLKPALCICIEEGSIEVAKLLIENGCSVNLPTGIGLTPLHLAVLNENYELTLLLLKNRANVNARDSMLQTPLHAVCSTGCFATYLALMDAGAEINTTDVDNRTPLMHACLSGNTMIALALLDKGADVNFVDYQNNTALVYALSFEPSVVLIKRLIQVGAEVNPVRGVSIPILCFLRCLPQNFSSNISEACDILKFLIASGCKLNVSTCGGHNPLHIAVAYGMVAIVKILLNCGCYSRADRLGRTPLFYACYHNFKELVRLLVASGISWNREAWLQNVAFREACNKNLVDFCVEELQRFPKLSELSRTVIRKVFAPDIEKHVDCLRYPPVLREYIKLEHY